MTACCRRFIHPAKQTSRNDSGFIPRLSLCRPRRTSLALEPTTSRPLAIPTISTNSVRSNSRTLRGPLSRIVEHGEVEWTNNLVENKIRPTALGKKNFMFFGSEEAGQGNAVVYTLIANCRLHGVEPCEYLKDVLTRLPYMSHSQVPDLTPLKWKANREKITRRAA